MSIVSDFVDAVDAFRPLNKNLVATTVSPKWETGRDINEKILLIPIEIDGEQRGQRLIIKALPNERNLTFMLGILFLDHMVCRLDFDPYATHGNNFQTQEMQLPLVIKGPHWHKWTLNRDRVKGLSSLQNASQLNNAEEYRQSRQFDATLRTFCSEWSIAIGYHTIELPSKDLLL